MELNDRHIRPIMDALTKVDTETLEFIFKMSGIFCTVDYLTILTYLNKEHTNLNLESMLEDINSNYIPGCNPNGMIVAPSELPDELPELEPRLFLTQPTTVEAKMTLTTIASIRETSMFSSLEQAKHSILKTNPGLKSSAAVYRTYKIAGTNDSETTSDTYVFNHIGIIRFDDETVFIPKWFPNNKQIIN